MSIYHLPQGQYGYCGHVINIPQDVISFANLLPRLPSNLDVLIVRKGTPDEQHHDFCVRKHVVEQALYWLISNNKYYQANQVRISQEVLAQLPNDGHLNGLRSVVIEDSTSSEAEAIEESCYDGYLSRSSVPNAACSMTEEESVHKLITDHQQTSSRFVSTMMWPTIGGTPINEFTTEGYFSLAFPTLFPTGAAEFLGQRHNPITIGYYFKHLMMYDDGRFAKHARFRFFALNTEMRWRAIQTGRVYVKQNPGDAQLSLDELRDMIGREGDSFSNRVLHYGINLRGTKQYWYKQRSNLIAMVDTLGLPTIFFTHSAADLQWPELANLICSDPTSKASRAKAVIENPAIADWFFTHRIHKFIDAYYIGVLGASDYWLRFEWQHRGSPHVHGLAWLPNAPNVECLMSSHQDDTVKARIIQYADHLVSTMNPGILPDGSNSDDAPTAKTDPHICNKSYSEVTDFKQDLIDLVATCQRHSRCSTAYCLRTRNGQQMCRFHFPKDLQLETTVVIDETPTLLTARNDGLLNSFNTVQLSGWRANVDMQYIVSRKKVIEYCTKYVTKSESRSQSLRDVYTTIVRSLKEGNRSLKAVQKILINSVGERDYSAQETCHLLLQLPLIKTSRDFIVVNLDGSRAIEDHLQENERATTPSFLDHYMVRPTKPHFNDINLLQFCQQYTMPKVLGSVPNRRSKSVIVVMLPYYPSDPAGAQYEQYCRLSLTKHTPFHQFNELLAGKDTYAEAYRIYLQSENIPSSLADDIYRLQHTQDQSAEDNDVEVRIL